MSSKSIRTASDEIWKNKTQKINAEFFTLTYGSVVSQLCRDYDNEYHRVNQQLFKMGYNIGIRLIEEFLAKTGVGRCSSFKETAEIVSKVGFRIFLNIVPTVSNFDGKLFSLILNENPLSEFVELPTDGKANKELWYSNILCGVLKGALQLVQLDCDVFFVSDQLRGSENTEIKVKFLRYLRDEIPAGED